MRSVWRRVFAPSLLVTLLVAGAYTDASTPVPQIDWDASLHVRHIDVFAWGERGVCAFQVYLGFTQYRDGAVWGVPSYFGEARSEGTWDLVYHGNGHTVALRLGSDIALVDGRPMKIEGKVYDDGRVPYQAPLSRIGKILGHDFVVGSYSYDRYDRGTFYWVVHARSGMRPPGVLDQARRILVADDGWLTLLRDAESGGQCGVIGRVSRSLITSPGGPWGVATAAARDFGWMVRWDGRRRTGQIRFGRASVRVATSAAGETALVGRKAYRVPGRLRGAAQRGTLVVPLEPVLSALGWAFESNRGKAILYVRVPRR